MARVIVERPRIPAHKARKGRRRDLEDLPSHEGMRRAAELSGDRKMLNENLKPLRRYVDKRVGRPWDKVYSEIAAHLRVDSIVQQHVRDHLKDFVTVKPRRGINSCGVSGAPSGISSFMSTRSPACSAARISCPRRKPAAAGCGKFRRAAVKERPLKSYSLGTFEAEIVKSVTRVVKWFDLTLS